MTGGETSQTLVWTEIKAARQERGALSPSLLLRVSLSWLLLKGLGIPAVSRGRSCEKSVTFAKMSSQAALEEE